MKPIEKQLFREYIMERISQGDKFLEDVILMIERPDDEKVRELKMDLNRKIESLEMQKVRIDTQINGLEKIMGRLESDQKNKFIPPK